MTWIECTSKGILCYLISYETLGILAWVAAFFTLIGLLVAINQSVKARRAAESASRAAGNLQIHVDAVNLAYLSAQLNTVMHLVGKDDCELAYILFGPIKRSIRIYAYSNFGDGDIAEELRRGLGVIDSHLEWGRTGNEKFNSVNMNRRIDQILALLARWESGINANLHQEIAK